MTEAQFKARLKLALGATPALSLWEQPVGVAFVPAAGKLEGPYLLARGATGAGALEALAGLGLVRRIRFGREGMADLSGIAHGTGRRLELEVKSVGGRRHAEQVRWAEFIAGAGGIYYLAQPERNEPDDAAVERCSRAVLELATDRGAR